MGQRVLRRLHKWIMFVFYRSDNLFKNKEPIWYFVKPYCIQALVTIHYRQRASKHHLMSERQCFGILGALHWSKLLYGKIHTDADNIYKGEQRAIRTVQAKPRTEKRGEKKTKKAKNSRSDATGCNCNSTSG